MKNESKGIKMENSIPENTLLINYLHDKLTTQEKRKVEELISDDLLLGDALEGLQQMNNPEALNEISSSLERMIDKNLTKKKKKQLRPIGFPAWMTLLITITLLAVLSGYILIKMLHR